MRVGFISAFASVLVLATLSAPAHAGSIGYSGRGYGGGYFYDEQSNRTLMYSGIVYVDAGATYSDDGSENFGGVAVFSNDRRFGTVLNGVASVSWGGGGVGISITDQDLTASIWFDAGDLDPAIGGIASPKSGGGFDVHGWSGDIAGTLGATPEPSTLVMLALGMLGLAGMVRRRRWSRPRGTLEGRAGGDGD